MLTTLAVSGYRSLRDLVLSLDGEPTGDLVTWSALTARAGRAELRVLRGAEVKDLSLDLSSTGE